MGWASNACTLSASSAPLREHEQGSRRGAEDRGRSILRTLGRIFGALIAK
jgi:hypothetical protein